MHSNTDPSQHCDNFHPTLSLGFGVFPHMTGLSESIPFKDNLNILEMSPFVGQAVAKELMPHDPEIMAYIREDKEVTTSL